MGGNVTRGGVSKFLKRYRMTLTLQNKLIQAGKECTIASYDKKIKILRIGDRRKSSGCIEDEMAQ